LTLHRLSGLFNGQGAEVAIIRTLPIEQLVVTSKQPVDTPRPRQGQQ
jgi:hypothetical protein